MAQTKYKKGTFLTIPNKQVLAGMNPNEQVIFFWICNFSNDEGVCFPSRKTLADCAGVSIRTVVNVIDKLIEKGLLNKKERKNGLTNTSNEYQILIAGADEGGADDTRGVVQDVHGGGAYPARGVVHQMHTNSIPDELNPTNSIDSMSAFDQFWTVYPNKELKKRTKEIWEQKRLETKLKEILDFIEEAKKTDRWKKGYIKQPPAFLNGECWEDDLTTYNDKKHGNNAPNNALPAKEGKYKKYD